jgi:uncharacterized protein YdaU (DUF1376 family)
MAKPPAFQFYPRDFLVGCAMLSAEAVGGYIRLLCYQWEHGYLPDDDEQLARLGGCSGNAVASIRHKFGIKSAGKLANTRLEEVRAEQSAFSEKQRIKAKKRWETGQNDATGYATALPVDMPESCPASASATALREEKIERPIPPKPKKPRAPKPPAQTDDEWLDSLSALHENAGISVRYEFTRMHDWCKKKNQTPSRRRFVKWLERADRPLVVAEKPFDHSHHPLFDYDKPMKPFDPSKNPLYD